MDDYVLGVDALGGGGGGHGGGGHGGHGGGGHHGGGGGGGRGFGNWGGGWGWGGGPWYDGDIVDVDVYNFDNAFQEDLRCTKYDANGNCIEYQPSSMVVPTPAAPVAVVGAPPAAAAKKHGRPAWQTALIVVGSILGAAGIGYGAYRVIKK